MKRRSIRRWVKCRTKVAGLLIRQIRRPVKGLDNRWIERYQVDVRVAGVIAHKCHGFSVRGNRSLILPAIAVDQQPRISALLYVKRVDM